MLDVLRQLFASGGAHLPWLRDGPHATRL